MTGASDVVDDNHSSYLSRYIQAFTHVEDYYDLAWWATFDDLLSQYLCRSLTNDSDILAAFLAIIRSLDVNHFWGVPFRSGEESSLDHALLKLLSWIPNLNPNTDTRLALREGFPTWSWTAWKGKWSFQGATHRSKDNSIFRTELAVETVNGQPCSLADYCSAMGHTGDLTQFLPFLDIQGWIALVQFRRDPEGTYKTTSVFDQKGRYLDAAAEILDVDLPGEPEWSPSRFLVGTWPLLVFIEQRDSEDIEVMVSGLVLKPCQNDTYQRLGVLVVTTMNLERDNEDRLQLWNEDSRGILECERRSIRLA
jgi:hypothetical protein